VYFCWTDFRGRENNGNAVVLHMWHYCTILTKVVALGDSKAQWKDSLVTKL
jgi:hypothetical protein